MINIFNKESNIFITVLLFASLFLVFSLFQSAPYELNFILKSPEIKGYQSLFNDNDNLILILNSKNFLDDLERKTHIKNLSKKLTEKRFGGSGEMVLRNYNNQSKLLSVCIRFDSEVVDNNELVKQFIKLINDRLIKFNEDRVSLLNRRVNFYEQLIKDELNQQIDLRSKINTLGKSNPILASLSIDREFNLLNTIQTNRLFLDGLEDQLILTLNEKVEFPHGYNVRDLTFIYALKFFIIGALLGLLIGFYLDYKKVRIFNLCLKFRGA